MGLGFAERLAGGHHPPGSGEPDKSFALDLVARPGRGAWSVEGELRAQAITTRATVTGVIQREREVLRYVLVVDGTPLVIEGEKRLRLRDPYASLSMFRGSFREEGREVSTIRARVDLRSEWRFCLQNLRLSLRAP